MDIDVDETASRVAEAFKKETDWHAKNLLSQNNEVDRPLLLNN